MQLSPVEYEKRYFLSLEGVYETRAIPRSLRA